MLPALLLREDLFFEWKHIGASDETVQALSARSGDGFSFYVRSYFFRGSMRSLFSAWAVLQRLSAMPEFQELLRTSGRLAEFRQHHSAVSKAQREFRDLRHRFGGHVEEDVAKRREHIADDELLPISWEAEADGVGLGSELAHAVVLACLIDKNDRADVAEARLGRMADATLSAFRALTIAVTAYFEKSW